MQLAALKSSDYSQFEEVFLTILNNVALIKTKVFVMTMILS